MNDKRSLLHKWSGQGCIAQENISKALKTSGILPDNRAWLDFIDRLLLWLGVVSLCCSVIFFFAYNWNGMGRITKFALIEAGIAAALVGYWRLGPEQAAGKGCLTAAALLLGGLLALFGQTYQTGADPWQLFASWAVLILPWVMTGRFAPLWLVWILLVNVAIYLHFSLFPSLWGLFFDHEIVLTIGFLVNSAALIVWELAARRYTWLQMRWAVRLVAVLSGSAITSLMMQIILHWNNTGGWSGLLYPLWLAAIYHAYRYAIKDLFMLAGMCLSLLVVITTFLSRLLLDFADAGGFLLVAMAVIGMSAASAIWLKQLHGELET